MKTLQARKRTPLGPRRDLDAQISPIFSRRSSQIASITVCGRTRREGPAGGTGRERSADRIDLLTLDWKVFRARKRTPFGPRRDLDAQISPTFGRGSLRVASRTVCGRTRRAGPAGGTRRERSADRINPGLFTGRCWPRKTEGFSAGIGRIWTKAGTVESPFCRPRPWGVKGRRVTAQDKTRSVRPRGRFVLFVFDVCGSSNDAWESFENNTSAKVLGGVNLRAAVPSLQLPNLFKRDDDGKIVLTKGDEYYDDDSPYTTEFTSTTFRNL